MLKKIINSHIADMSYKMNENKNCERFGTSALHYTFISMQKP